MHEFPRYAAPSPADEWRLVRDNPFALVVSGSNPPVASHVPVVLPDPQRPPAGRSLPGTTLLGHMARINPQWQGFDSEVLVVFSAPHAYVSPTTYRRTPSVPTWNYAAVHVTGPVQVITDRDETLAVVEHTVRVAESTREPAWDMTPSRSRFADLVEHVVAFRVTAREVRSNFKLSQDMPPEIRARVRADLRDNGHGATADLMVHTDPDGPAPDR